MGFAVHRHARPVHDFEQRRLGLRRCAIDFVREHDIGEDWAFLENELLDRLVINRDARDIARQEIARELHARKRTVHRARQRIRQSRLADPRQILDEQMPAGDEAGDDLLDDVILALDREPHVGPQTIQHLFGRGNLTGLHEIAHGRQK